MLTQTCSSLPATCCTVSRRQTFNQVVRSKTSTLSAGQLSKPGSTPSHSFQLFSSRLQKHRARVANPRHDDEQDTIRQSTNSWDEAPPSEDGQVESQQASGVDWAKMQSLAALTGASTLAAVVVLQLSGKANISGFAYDNVAESMQQALPEQRRGQQDKAPRQLFDIGALVQTAKGEMQREGLALQEGVQKEGLALQGDSTKPDKPAPKDKVKSERQASLEKSKQVKTAKNEQNKKEKEQRQKQKDKEKEAAEKKLKEQKEKERKEAEKRKKFRDQALVGGSIFGMSALTFGKWQLVASLGAVVFRTIGGPTILSSVLRTPGYIIGRGVRVVEWDVSEHPDHPDGDLVSLKLRALTPDGIRMAIAKEYGLSNYREVRQVSHWVTTAVPHFFEPMRTAATFKMLPDPAFVVWSRHPPTGRHTLPTRADQAPTSDTAGKDPLAGLPTDQVTAVMLKTISGVAAASRRLAQAGHCKPAQADRQQHRSNGARHSHSGDAPTDTAEHEHTSRQARQADGRLLHSSSSSHPSSHSSSHSSSHASLTPPQSARHESGRHASTSAHATPSHQSHRGNGNSSSLESSAGRASQPSVMVTQSQPESAGVKEATQSASHRQQNGTNSERSYGGGDHSVVQANSRDQPQHSSESGRKTQSVTPSRGSGKENGNTPLGAVASSLSNKVNGVNSSDNSSQEVSQNEGQSGHYQSDEDEVAGALQDETDANGPPARTKDPRYWHEPAVLQAVCGNPSVSAGAWGDRLQLSSSFVAVSEAEEEALVLAVGASGDYLLSLFRAYAPHNVVTFMHYARRHCHQT